MAKSICLYFQIHQPARLRLYRFFDIGKDSHYYDDFANRTILKRIAGKCYLPMNKLLSDLVEKHNGKFKVAFSISGSALEQFDRYAPEVLDSFKMLADTGNVEFLCETYNHSLASVANSTEFRHQVEKHKETIRMYFNRTPKVFRNTELIYNNYIGEQVRDMGFYGMLSEGAKHVLGWRSPNYVYGNPAAPELRLLLRNYTLSDDISFRFSNRTWSDWPLTSEKYLQWLKNAVAEGGDVINLFMDYETFGEHQNSQSGIFEFMTHLADLLVGDDTFEFATPSEVIKKHAPVANIDISETISWADEERDVSAWLGNELQQDAFNKLYNLYEKLSLIDNSSLWNDFGHLQESDHFYYMCTKFFSDGEVHKYFNPYDSPYDAFINYMNVLSDFIFRVNDEYSNLDAKFAVRKDGAEGKKISSSKRTVKKEEKKVATSAKKTEKKNQTDADKQEKKKRKKTGSA